MPLPWLIGAAVVAATAAVIKAVSDDDSSSSSSSSSAGAAERQRQEREASRQRERGALEAQLAGKRKSQLEEASAYLACSLEALGKAPDSIGGLSCERFQDALKADAAADFEYAQLLSTALRCNGAEQDANVARELDSALGNLLVLERLFLGGQTSRLPEAERQAAIELSKSERKDLDKILAADERLEALRSLKQQIQAQG
ncbi:hypothetical protein NK553_14075 [Pseudomonas sp. ZM23]|uniref:Uncharacterized protein n=1 Tax=Pseudomonas triclosanedens TaxID=2961893 RepID=A0ABY7A5H1_9PSED|nr:hypothetical protein [Pseudomonas triclosanedens]MCP8465076.1 hypothetical protein [Pseudomonas triclosanedens]MCP8470212.1 hypothetical protein [Pseudomonas triclosanedens]MCP8476017.1 hypothetical protein [Pseudomonas triclosanedens]WAI51746.1 hypothetical protein OU419_11005 [Pseudomonas triclosanedens]